MYKIRNHKFLGKVSTHRNKIYIDEKSHGDNSSFPHIPGYSTLFQIDYYLAEN